MPLLEVDDFSYQFYRHRLPRNPRSPGIVTDRGRGLDIAEQFLRDVFNDVSKYIGNISISLNAVLPKLPDNHDHTHSHGDIPHFCS